MHRISFRRVLATAALGALVAAPVPALAASAAFVDQISIAGEDGRFNLDQLASFAGPGMQALADYLFEGAYQVDGGTVMARSAEDGSGNTVQIVQVSTAEADVQLASLDDVPALPGNFAEVRQYGFDNLARVAQFGEGNRATIDQDGVELAATFVQVGFNNQAEAIQRGVGNTALIFQNGADNIASIQQSNSFSYALINQAGLGNFASVRQ